MEEIQAEASLVADSDLLESFTECLVSHKLKRLLQLSQGNHRFLKFVKDELLRIASKREYEIPQLVRRLAAENIPKSTEIDFLDFRTLTAHRPPRAQYSSSYCVMKIEPLISDTICPPPIQTVDGNSFFRIHDVLEIEFETGPRDVAITAGANGALVRLCFCRRNHSPVVTTLSRPASTGNMDLPGRDRIFQLPPLLEVLINFRGYCGDRVTIITIGAGSHTRKIF